MSKWKKVKLGDVCSLYQPKTIPMKELKDDMPYYVYGANGIIGKYHSYNHIDSEIAIACRGATCGTVNITLPKSWITGNAMVAHIKRNDLFFKYLFYALSNTNMKNIITGAAQPQITRSNLKDLEFPLPPIEEQKKIAARLDAVAELLEKQKQLLAEQDTLIQSLFYDTFGIPFKNDKNFKMLSIGDIVSDVQYGTSKKADTSGSTPILRMNNIKYSGEMDYSDLKFIDLGEETSKYLLKKGDILFNRTNSKELVGKTGLYNFDSPMVYAGYLIRVRLKDNFLPICFSVYMNTPYLKAFFLEKCKSIVGMANINAKELQKIPIYLPPFELQEKFAVIVEQIEEKKQKIKSAIAETQTLFNALMAEYFEE